MTGTKLMELGRKRPDVFLAGLFLLLLAVLTIFPGWFAPYGPSEMHPTGIDLSTGGPLAPGMDAAFPLGTDHMGRDLMSRLLFGAQTSLLVGVASNLMAVFLGVLVGGLAGYFGGLLEIVLMRAVDIVMSIPLLLLAIALSPIIQPSVTSVILVIGFVYWTNIARVVYGEVLSVKERDFVAAATSLGASDARLMLRHILPNVLPLIVVYATLGIATTIRVEAILGFLGVGVPPPAPSWGGMMQEALAYFRSAPWLLLFPGLMVTLTVLTFTILGEYLNQVLNPLSKPEIGR